MPYYLFQAAYTGAAWSAQTANPGNSMDRVQPIVEGLGGRLESFYFAFGEYDVIAIAQLPDNLSAAALSVAVSAGGAEKDIKTTPS